MIVHAVFVGPEFYGVACLHPRQAVEATVRKWTECTSQKPPFDVNKLWMFLQSEGFSIKECKLEEV